MNGDRARELAEQGGSHWFDAASMRWFRSRVLDSTWTLIRDDEVVVWRFVSSERNRYDPRLYTIRELRTEIVLGIHGTTRVTTVQTVGEFQAYRSARAALRHIRD